MRATKYTCSWLTYEVSENCTYCINPAIRPAEFGQILLVTASVKEYENRLVLDYFVIDEQTGEKLTKGRTIQVAVEIESGELQLASPAVLMAKIEAIK